ncbi:MAG: tetratricopeptide repeat protein [Woeseiaceae bacterium]
MTNLNYGTAMKAKRWKPVIMTLLLAMAGQSLADSVPAAYNMAVIKDDAYGMTVMSGNYGKGIDKINAFSGKRARSFPAKTNLCVAYTMSRDFDNAEAACEAALTISEKYGKYGDSPISPNNRSRDQAMAYSNRGVLRAMTGDYAGAKQDFEYASELSKSFEAPEINLARLTTKEDASLSSL